MAIGLQVWSKTPVSNATADSNINFAEGMAPSQLNDSSRAVMGSAASWRDDNNTSLITSGTSAALTLVTNQVEGSLTAGYTVAVTLGTKIDTNATLAVDGLTAAPIQPVRGSGVLAGSYSSGDNVSLVYSSTGTGQWIVKHTVPVLPAGDPKSPAGGTLNATPPPAFTGTSLKMMGMGATFVFVPKTTGRCSLQVSLTGQIVTAATANRAQIYFGTGGAASAPTSGAAVTGTSAGLQQIIGLGASNYGTFTPNAIITGLTIGTSYWVDLALALSASTINTTAATFTYQEF